MVVLAYAKCEPEIEDNVARHDRADRAKDRGSYNRTPSWEGAWLSMAIKRRPHGGVCLAFRKPFPGFSTAGREIHAEV